MARVGWFGKRACALVAVATLIGGVLTSWPTAAGAAGGESGELGIKGVGTVYAAPEAVPVLVSTPGAASMFTLEVVNTGPVTSQYNLKAAATFNSCDPSGCPSAAVAYLAGSANITASVTAANGYFTAPIAPHTSAVYTLKLTTPKTAVPDNLYQANIDLRDTAGNVLSSQAAIVEIKATTGTSPFDQFVNGAGQSTLRAPETAFNPVVGVSAQNVAVGQGATFTVKLQNDAPLPGQIGYRLADRFSCSSVFAVNVKAGTIDITSLALAGTYLTPMLAHGKSIVLTVKITLISSPRPCMTASDEQWESDSSSGSNAAGAVLVVNLAFGT